MNLAPTTPQLTAVDPFAVAVNPADTLKPARPFWYSVDRNGLTILRLDDNWVVGSIPWPQTIDMAQPDGSYLNVPAPAGGWDPVGMVVSYPTDEQLASNSETPATSVFVVMAHSGYEWRSNPSPPDLRSPNLRDTIVPSTNAATESGMLVMVDVTDPTFSAPPVAIGGAILGHRPGQPAYDPATGNVYVANMPTMSLPTTTTVPNDLTSFVSVIGALAPPVVETGEAGAPSPPTILTLCGPEHPEEGILAGMPQAWACIAEGGEGPFVWEFSGLPSWLIAHPDKLTGVLDGILYGTPPTDGAYTFQVRVTDNGAEPSFTSDWTSITLNVTPTGVPGEAEAEFEAGVPAAIALEGTGTCEFAATASPGSLVPEWIDVARIPGRRLENPTAPGGYDETVGCVVMGTAPISGEYFEFSMPNFKFAYPFDREQVIFSGQVLGAYMFDPLPFGVGLSGLAWHQINKIHDPSTEADLLNAEFFAVEPFTGQLYRIATPYAELEVGDLVAAPATRGELDEVSVYASSAQMLAALTAARPDIAAVLAANPSLSVKFGDLVVEANPNPNIFVTAREISDPTGVNPVVIPIGGPIASQIPVGALLKVTGIRDAADPTVVTVSAISVIDLPQVQAYFLGLDSNLAPAAKGQAGVPDEPGQVDHGVLWVTGTNTGSVAVVDTALAQVAQSLAVSGAASLGGVSVNFATGSAYVAGKALQNVTIFGTGSATPPRAPVIWGGTAEHGLELTWYVGWPVSHTVMTTGWPVPTLSLSGALPAGVTFTNNGDGTGSFAGTPAPGTDVAGLYSLTLTAANGVSPNATQAVAITVGPTPVAPVITSAPTTTFTVGVAGTFTVTATGEPIPVLVPTGLPGWLTFTDNYDGTAVLAGTPPAAGNYSFTITATNAVAFPDAVQTFTLIAVGNPRATGVTLTTNVPSPQPAGTPIVFTATGAGSTGYQYRFYARAPGETSYTMVQEYSPTDTWTLPGSSTAGQWSVLVYVRTNSNVLVDAQAYKLFTLSATIPPATGVTLTTNLPSPQQTGTPIVFTATGAGSSGYQYRFYAKAPGETSYTMVQEYSPTDTWTLPGSSAAGQWSVLVYVRTNPTVLLDAQAYRQFTLRNPPATGVTITTDKVSPAGSPVVFTATGAGSAGYQYRFYARAPGATSYTMVQDYGSTNTWTLSTSVAGQWSVLVYVRTNSNVLVDAQAYRLFTIRVPPATGVTISTDRASPQPVGTPIVFTAMGAGSSGYQYRFYARAPGATSYTMVQDYGSASSWTLSTTTAGQWSVLVYVRTSPNVLLDAQSYRLFTLY